MDVVIQAQTDEGMMHGRRQYMQCPHRKVDHGWIWYQGVGLFDIWVYSNVDSRS